MATDVIPTPAVARAPQAPLHRGNQLCPICHPPLTHYGWLGSGPHAVKYAKRILSLALTFGAAHLSTFKFEKPLLEIGKTLASRIEKRAPR